LKGSIQAALALVVLLPCARAGAADPVGALEGADCAGVRGWAQDPDQPMVSIDVHVYFNGPPGDPLGAAVAVNAKEARDDLCMMLGSCDHGYLLELPLGVRDGVAHNVWVYGIDLEAVNNPLIGGPLEVTCPAPPIVGGVRRWITSPEVLAAWQFSTFVDLLKVDDVALGGVPESVDWPAAPMLAVSDAGDGTLWLLDGTFRREVPQDAIAAWRFAPESATVTAAAQLEAMPQGPDMRVRPFLVQGTMPAVYLLDDAPCEPSGCPQDDTGGTDGEESEGGEEDSGPATTDGGDTSGAPDPTDAGSSDGGAGTGPGIDPGGDDAPVPSSGCGCTAAEPRIVAPSVALLVLARRRRQGEQTSKSTKDKKASRFSGS
jgi:hypothetical protein